MKTSRESIRLWVKNCPWQQILLDAIMLLLFVLTSTRLLPR
jgi:hypothetical protein